MKKISLLVVFLFSVLIIHAQSWKPVDLKKTVTDPKIAVASDGIIYIVGHVYGKTNSATLFKSDGKTISKIWEPDYTKPHSDVSIAIGANDLPILSYKESDIAIVKQFDGKTMVDVAKESPSPKSPNYLKMATDKTGVPYVFYNKDGFFYIQKLVNGAWEQQVEAKFVGDYRVAFDSKNVVHVVFKDKRFVKRLEDGALVDVGPTYYKMSVNEFAFAFDNNDVPYMSYGSFENGEMKIVKFDGTDWKPVVDPATDFKGKGGSSPAMAFDNNNTLYFTWAFRSTPIEGTHIRRLDGETWVPMHAGIDEEDIKRYDGIKQLIFCPKANTLTLNRPFYTIKLK